MLRKKVGYLLLTAIVILLIIIAAINLRVLNNNVLLSDEEKQVLLDEMPLIYCADNNAQPLRFVDEDDGQYKGVVVDYINVVSLKLGIKIQLYPKQWDNALDSLKKGETHICDMFKSEERSKHFLFSKPIYDLRAVVATVDGSKPINDMTFALQRGDYIVEWFNENYPDLNIVYVENINKALNLLIEGKVDSVAGDEPVVINEIKKKGLVNIIHILDEPLYQNEVVLAVTKDKAAILPILNKAIDAIDSRELQNIQQKWFGISTPIVKNAEYYRNLRIAVIGVGVLALLIICMIALNYYLKVEVDRRTREVVDAKSDLETVFDNMSEYIMVFNKELEAININKSFVNYLGGKCQTFLGKSFDEIWDGKDYKMLTKIVVDTRDNEKANEMELNIKSNYFVVKTSPLRDMNDNVKNILLVLNNITKEKVSEKQLLHRSKMAAIGQLAAGMSHEIRNPLGIIRNHSYILRNIGNDECLKKRSLDYIDSSVERAKKIIENVLNFSRLSSCDNKWINLYDITDRILELESKTLDKKGISYKLMCQRDLQIISNEESIKHIVINLLSNAVDAINENGLIEIIIEKNEDCTKMRIIDDGVGLEEEEIEHIFNPFYTTKNPDKGTGLGLYIVYNEVKKLGGDISVTCDERTMFEILLPNNEAREDNYGKDQNTNSR